MSWDEFDDLAAILARKLRNSEIKPDLIIAVARGGLIPATVLGHYFQCRLFGILTIRRTISDRPFSLPPTGIHLDSQALPEDSALIQTVLLVDDIIGHGLTLSLAKRILLERYFKKRIVLAALVDDMNLARDPSATSIHPYVTAYEMSDADWVVFPWESITEVSRDVDARMPDSYDSNLADRFDR